MYHISDSIMEHIDEPHVIGIFIGDSAEPALSSSDDLASCVYNAHFCGGGLTIGALCSANVSVSAYGQHDLSGRDIIVKLGFGDPLEWLQLGAFRVCECHVGDDTTAITAYDAAYWATGGEYTPTIQIPTSVRAVLEDVCEQCGMLLGELPATADRVIDGRLTGYTTRQIIMHMAAVCGCNAIIDRSGALRLKWLSDNGQSIGPDEYYADELTNATTINIVGAQMKIKITTPSTDPDTGITVEHEEEKIYSSASGTGRVLAVDCPYANQELVDNIADDVSPFSYAVGSVSFIGGYDVEPGDTLSVTSLSGAVHSVPVLGLTLSLDDGCRATVTADGYSDTDADAKFYSEYQQALKRIEADVIAVKNLSAKNFEAQTAYIKNLSADEAFVNAIFAKNISGNALNIQMTQKFSMGGLLQNNYQRVYAGASSLQGADSYIEFESRRSPINPKSSVLAIQPEKISAITDSFSVSGSISEGGTALENKYLKLSGGMVAGDIIIRRPDWSFSALYMQSSGDNSQSAFFIGQNASAFWRLYKGGTYYDIRHPGNGGTIALTMPSSRRYKTSIEPLPFDVVKGLYGLPVHTYVYKDGFLHEMDERYGKRIPGFIAEELEKILPIAVDHVDGKVEMWNSNIVVPCLLRLVQDLNERLEDERKKRESLEKRLERLERMIGID